MSNKRLSKAKLDQMRKDYLDYMSVKGIAEKYDVSRSTVQHHVSTKWQGEREMLKAELYRNLADTKQVEFTNITNSTIKILSKALQALADRHTPPTIQEANGASKILEILDKITRLDEEKPTEIIGNKDKPMTIDSVRQKIGLDPFSKIEDVEVKEIEKEEDVTN